MPSYTYKQTEHHQMNRIYEYEFDTTNHDDWNALLELAESSGVDVSDLPSEPPEDPLVWTSLLEDVSLSDVAEYEDDIWTMDEGGYDISTELIDSDGNIVD